MSRCKSGQWVSMHNANTQKQKQLNGIKPSLILFTPVLYQLWHEKGLIASPFSFHCIHFTHLISMQTRTPAVWTNSTLIITQYVCSCRHTNTQYSIFLSVHYTNTLIFWTPNLQQSKPLNMNLDHMVKHKVCGCLSLEGQKSTVLIYLFILTVKSRLLVTMKPNCVYPPLLWDCQVCYTENIVVFSKFPYQKEQDVYHVFCRTVILDCINYTSI